MTIPTLSTAPPAPDRSADTPTQFAAKADDFVKYLEGLYAELNAWAAAVTISVSGTDFNATSTSNVAVGTGSKTFTIQANKLYQTGQFVIVANTATPSNWMYGQVTSYSGTTLIVNVANSSGSGSFNAWSVGLAPNAVNYMPLAGGNFVGLVTTATPAAGQEAFVIPHGIDPSSPTDGSFWTKTTGLFVRINGANYLGGIPVSSNKLLGRTTAGTGSMEEIAAGPGLAYSALNLEVESSLMHAANGGM